MSTARLGAFAAVTLLLALLATLVPQPAKGQTIGGAVQAWGWNADGQLGDGTTIRRRLLPNSVVKLTNVTDLTAGYAHNLALSADGSVWAWGNNHFGQLGDGTTNSRSRPVQVLDLGEVMTLAAGVNHSLALKPDGTVLAWGYNVYGQLGDGTTRDRQLPVPVDNLTNVTALEAGYQSLALRDDGTVWAWGYNGYGQLGDGTITDRPTPASIGTLSNVTAIAAAFLHSLALKQDGTVWAWGHNGYGQLGDGTTADRPLPGQVQNLTNVIALAASGYHSLALKADGTVWAWGNNHYGQLGDGSSGTIRSNPVQVAGLTEVVAIDVGLWHSLALKQDGTVWAWGNNQYGQLGDGTNTNRSLPVRVLNLDNPTAIAAGWWHSLAIVDRGSAQLIADPNDGEKTALLVTGTPGNDTIGLNKAGSEIEVIVNGNFLGTFAPSGLLLVRGDDGDDKVTVDLNLLTPSVIYGENGDDIVVSGNGSSILVGGDGEDRLSGGGARDLLIGGEAADALKGNNGDDILIAGTTSFDAYTAADVQALEALRAEWTRTDVEYQGRIDHLTGASGGGLNGTTLLTESVFNDTKVDKLTGSNGLDWFMLNFIGSGRIDTATDRSGAEIRTDL